MHSVEKANKAAESLDSVESIALGREAFREGCH